MGCAAAAAAAEIIRSPEEIFLALFAWSAWTSTALSAGLPVALAFILVVAPGVERLSRRSPLAAFAASALGASLLVVLLAPNAHVLAGVSGGALYALLASRLRPVRETS